MTFCLSLIFRPTYQTCVMVYYVLTTVISIYETINESSKFQDAANAAAAFDKAVLSNSEEAASASDESTEKKFISNMAKHSLEEA